ncbi:MAG: large subunit ribosomal protein [Kosmotogales bacterium]|nr:large subunit ribosomal protein [Kosmotogales bacterium]
MAKKSKRYLENKKLVDRTKSYEIEEAAKLIKAFKPAKYDESLELHIKLNIDPAKADQQVRGTISLPNGTGKKVRILVFAKGEKEEEAKKAGAEFVGAEDLAEKIQGGWLDFDVAIATPDMMRVIGRLGRVLGPRGLMPSPKSGTVTMDIEEAVTAFKAGRVEVKNDKTSNVHIPFGKVSFDEEKIVENLDSAMSQILRMRPLGAKGRFFKGVYVSTSVGVGIKVDFSRFIKVL